MSDTDAKALLDRIESDEAFAERVKTAGSPAASQQVIESEGLEVTKEELRDAVLDRYGDKLTTEQLDPLAGGTNVDTIAWTVVHGSALRFM